MFNSKKALGSTLLIGGLLGVISAISLSILVKDCDLAGFLFGFVSFVAGAAGTAITYEELDN